MTTIMPPKNFPLPQFIGQIIAAKNSNSIFHEGEQWYVEAPTLLVFEGWFKDVLPGPWGGGIYTAIYKMSQGKYIKTYNHMYIVSDYPSVEITIPLPFDVAITLDEVSNRFGLHQTEALLGMLSQMTSSLLQTSPDSPEPESK